MLIALKLLSKKLSGAVAPRIDADQPMFMLEGQHVKKPCPAKDGSGMLMVFAPFWKLAVAVTMMELADIQHCVCQLSSARCANVGMPGKPG